MNNLPILLGFLLLALAAGCDSSTIPEHDVDQIIAPDNSFVLIITQTKEHFPYGVEGNIYLAESDGSNRRLVGDYFTDDHGELLGYIQWDPDQHAFRYTGKASPQFLGP